MRIIVAEDGAILREGMVSLLTRHGHKVVAEVGDADGLLSAVDEAVAAGKAPDLVITDVRMPPLMEDDGLHAAVQIRGQYPSIALLVFSQYVAPSYARQLFSPVLDAGGASKPGGLGYLLKDRITKLADFMQSLDVIAGGGMVVDPQVAGHLMRSRASMVEALTPREAEVLELMAQGLSNSEIQEKLFVSGASVAKHVANVFLKLGLGPEEENRRVRAVLMYLTESGLR